MPLVFAPGEAYQLDWSHEIVVIDGVTTTAKVAHMRLSHSRMAYPRESQEMVFDAHNRAFALFGGACARGLYDNMNTAVDAVFVGKAGRFNRRFRTTDELLPGGAGGVHAGSGVGEGTGGEPGWHVP